MIRIAFAAEAEGDVEIVATLLDRLLLETADWIEPELLDVYRCRTNIGDGNSWLRLHSVPELARARKLGRIYGHFDGKPGAEDALLTRKTLLLFAFCDPVPSLVVFVRDLDGVEDRRRGFKQACEERSWPFEVQGALAEPELEAWLVASWDPEDEVEETTLDGLRRQLGFDPTRHPQQLVNSPESPRDAKRVLGQLTARGRSAGDRWQTVALETLDARGEHCGLRELIEGLRVTLRKLVTGRQ